MIRHRARSAAAWAMRGSRRPLVLFLLGALIFELSMLAGVLASPFFRQWMPRGKMPVDDATAMLIRWRQSMYHRVLDPAVGQPAPPLTLTNGTGRHLTLAELRGRRVALLFTRDGNG